MARWLARCIKLVGDKAARECRDCWTLKYVSVLQLLFFCVGLKLTWLAFLKLGAERWGFEICAHQCVTPAFGFALSLPESGLIGSLIPH